MSSEDTTDGARLRFGAVDWRHPRWDTDYYPDDLPADWQLGYYANELAAVLLEPQQWLSAGPEQLAGWAGEVHAGFRFYLRAHLPTDPAWQLQLASALGGRLGGLLWPTAPAPLGTLAPLPSPASTIHAWGDGDGIRAALLEVAELDLRARRHLLEVLAPRLCREGGVAVFLADPAATPGAVRELQTVAELMGLA